MPSWCKSCVFAWTFRPGPFLPGCRLRDCGLALRSGLLAQGAPAIETHQQARRLADRRVGVRRTFQFRERVREVDSNYRFCFSSLQYGSRNVVPPSGDAERGIRLTRLPSISGPSMLGFLLFAPAAAQRTLEQVAAAFTTLKTN